MAISGINFTGLGSGLDTDKIIEGLLASQQQRISSLQANQSKIIQQQFAFKGIEAKIISLLGTAGNLGKSLNGVFDGKKATSNNLDLVTAAATSKATPGDYTLRVNSLARAQQIGSQGFASFTSAIKTGTFDIKVGSGATKTITIDGSNNTLQGLVTAINSSGADVFASIVNDGSDSRTNPYRLLLTSKKTGAANSITLTNNLTGGVGVQPVFDAAYINDAVTDLGYTGTSTPTANVGAGGYTGTANNTYTFTIASVNAVTTAGTTGTVDTDIITVDYTDTSNPANSGTITLDPGDGLDAGVFQSAAQGIQAQFAAGTLVVGEKFSIDAFVPNVQSAGDASLSIGSGAGALTINSASNTVDGVISGVTLNLLAADSTKDVTISVANDVESAKQAILDFVDQYNELVDYINERQTYNADTKVAGVLLGANAANSIEELVSRTVSSVVPGVLTQMNRLSALGIKLDDKGKLSVDQAKLDQALNGQLSGVAYNDVRRLFALDGVSTKAGIQFLLGSDKTLASTTPYQVDIFAAAEQASITASNPLAASTVITTGVNDELTISINDRLSGTIKLTAGTYSRLALAQELEAKINADSQLAGGRVAVSVNGGDQLVVTTEIYGSAAKATIGTGTALADLGFAGTETDIGLDVAGQFVVNGEVEAATGTGQVLSGNSGNANTSGLQLLVTLTPSQVVPFIDADLTVTRGIAAEFSRLLTPIQDPVTGRLKLLDDSLQAQIDQINESIERQTKVMDARRESLVKQFIALETAVSQLKSTSSFLSAQLGNVNLLGALKK